MDTDDELPGSSNYSDNECILYDILQLVEWPKEEIVCTASQNESELSIVAFGAKKVRSSMSRWTSTVARAVGMQMKTGSSCLLPSTLIDLVNGQGPWIFSNSLDGNFLAVLQEICLEIRASKEDFSLLIGSFSFSRDPSPQWRKIAWSLDSSTIAFSESDGTVHVCDLKGILLFSIKGQEDADNQISEYSYAICGLVFFENEMSKDALNLMIVSYGGLVTCIEVNDTYDMGYRVVFNFDIATAYPNGVSTVIYDKEHHLLLVGGCCGNTALSEGIPAASKCGISAWRLLSGMPFMKMIDLKVKRAELKQKFGVLRKLSTVPRDLGSILIKHPLEGIYTAVLSPSNNQLIAVHLNGSLSLWDVPSLRHRKTWRQEELPYFDEVNPEYNKNLSLSKRLSEYPFPHNIVDCNWWNDEAITLARFSGSLVIVKVSEGDTKNLLGDQCEWLRLAPRLSPTREGGFLILECDTRIKTLKRQRTESEEEAKKESEDIDPFLDDSDNEAKPGLSGRLFNQYKSMMYDLTEIEYFRPPRKRPKLVTKHYRLINLMKTTPEKLYKRKIEEEEYGEALSLARSYSLDCDKVFQRQWSKSSVSIASIQDYLRKVKKTSWVLHECCERVPIELDAARELLNFGLHFTDLDRVVYLQEGLADEVSEESGDSDVEEYAGFNVQEQRLQEIKKRDCFVHRWEKKIDLQNLTLEQKEIIRARRKILQYLDRLATYELLLGGYDAARERYNPERYAKFRQQNILFLAVEFAHAGDSKAVDILLTYHGNELREHRLPILSNFPKTLLASNYLDLLPEIDSDAVVVPWFEEYHRDTRDWCEDEKYDHLFHLFSASADAAEEIYQDYPELRQFRSKDVSGDLVCQWYMRQAVQMDIDACDIECALDILKIGKQRGIEGLDALIRDFCVLESLVYECEYDPGLTLMQIQKKSRLELLHMLMENSSRDMYVKNIQRWAIPFLKSCNEEKDRSAIKIFQDYIMGLSEEDIMLPSLVLTSFISNSSLPDFMLEWDWLVNLCLDSIYINENTDQLSLMNHMYYCLVNMDKTILRDKVSEAIEKINRLDKHIYACTMLAKYKVNVCPKFIKEVECDRQKVHKLFLRLSRTAANRETPLTRAEWYALLTDMLQLRKQVFSSTCTIEASICLEVFVESLLTSGSVTNFQIAGERMMRTVTEELEASKQYSYSPLQKLSYETSVELVIKSSQEYFDASSPTSDNRMLSLSQECLLLITDRPTRIQERLDLIEGVILLRSFGIDKLPLQVRLMQDRSNLITKALEVNDRVYKKTESLLRLGMLLRVCGSNKEERKGQILVKIVEKAITLKDFLFAFCLCQELVHMRYKPAWTVCWKLALCDEYHDMFAKQNILAFASCFCDVEKLEVVTQHLCLLNCLVLQEEIKLHEKQDKVSEAMLEEMKLDAEKPSMDNENAPESSEGFSPGIFMSPSKMLLSTAKGTRAVFSATGTVLSATGTVLSATSSTTKAILSNVSDSQWWRSTISETLNDQPNSERLEDQLDYDVLRVQDFEKQACPSFYSSVIQSSVSKYELDISSGTYFLPSTLSLNQGKLHCLRLRGRTDSVNLNIIGDEISLLKDLITVMPHDFALGLSYCLALPDIQAMQESFEKFPLSALSIQIVLYCFALVFLSATKKNDFDALSSIYETDATKLIGIAVELASSGTYEPNEELQKVVKYLLQWNEQLLDFTQGEKLHQLGRGIDLNRFMKDINYKEETILGLAMTTEEEQYTLAESVARRSEMSLWNVLITHLEYLFTECQDQVSTNNLRRRIEKLNMIPELNSKPAEFIRRMDNCVFPFISGVDHERLILYFTLLGECEMKDVDFLSAHNLCLIAPLDHVKMLRKIKTMTPNLDYKVLVTDNSKDDNDRHRIMTLLQPHLDKSNVQMFAKMIPKIPYSVHRISASTLYLQVIRDIVWKDVSVEENDIKSFSWQERYQSTVQFLRLLTPNDLLAFFMEFLFSDFSKLIPQQTRQELAKQGVKMCKNQIGKSKKNELDVDILQEGQSFNSVLPELMNMSKHVNSYSTSFISNMIKQRNEDPSKDKYLMLYDKSMSKPDPVLELAALMLCDGCSPSFIQHFLSVVPGNKWNVTNVLDMAVSNNLKLLSREENLKIKAFDQLTHLVDSVSSHEHQGGKVLSSRQVIDLLRQSFTNFAVSMETRVKVLQLLEERFKLDGSEAWLLLLHRTQAVIKDGWGDDVCNSLLPMGSAIHDVAEVVATEEKRVLIFDRLLSIQDKTLFTLKHLVTLLFMWPPMSDKTQCNRCFTDALTSMVAFGSEGGKEILNVVKDPESEVPADAVSCVFNTLIESELAFFAIKLALITNAPKAKDKVVQVMQSVTSMGPSQCDEELLVLLLKNNVAAKTIGTVYYPRIAEYLLSGECVDAEGHVHNLTRQLQEEGHVTEAGTLLLSFRGAHPAMRTFGNAMSSLARWLRS